MKQTIKLVLIFIGSLTAIIVGATTGYILINNNRTFYIYDVRLVEPIEGMKGYIYTDSEAEYTSIKNQTHYMSSKENNYYPIAVYVSTSDGSSNVNITSSDTSIAKITEKDGKCYYQILKEGTVKITSELHGVKDSITVKILDPIPSKVSVYDYDYYGDYAKLFPNKIVAYADGEEYRYKYNLSDAANNPNEHIDGELLQVDKSNVKSDIFSDVYIDSSTSELVVKCKEPVAGQTDYVDHSVIFLQSHYYSDDGSIVLKDTYGVSVDIVLYEPEFLQIEISGNPNFDEKVVYTKTQKVDISSFSDENILANPSILDDYLKTEKAENYLAANGEKSTNVAYLTDVVDTLYLRFRVVYTNGHIEYLKAGENGNASFKFNNDLSSEHCVLDPTGDYYTLKLNNVNYFTSAAVVSFDITLEMNDFIFDDDEEKTFSFGYKEQTNSNINSFYTPDTETGYYTYTYWDNRARFNNEIYENGKIVGFGE